MAFPYGLALSSFLDSYDRAEQRALQGRRGELQEALALRQLTEGDRAKREEEQVLEALARDEATRRGALPAPAGIPMIPGGMPAVPGMEAEAALAGMTAGPPVSAAPFMPPPSPRAPALSTLSPESAVRVMAHPTGQRVLKSVKEAEDAAEKRRLKEESQEFFKLASKHLDSGNALEASKELAKAYNRLEQYDRGSHYTDQTMKLVQDAGEHKKADADLARWRPFVQAHKTQPSLKTEEDLIGALGQADSLFGRRIAQDIVANKLKTALGKDVYASILDKEIEERALEMMEKGQPFDLDKIFADIRQKKPAVLWRGVKSNLEGNKAWGEKMIKALGGHTDLDPKDLQTAGARALVEFRRLYGREATEADFPKIQEITTQLRAADVKAEAEAKRAALTPQQQKVEQVREELLTIQLQRAKGELPMTEDQITNILRRVELVRREADLAPEELERLTALERSLLSDLAEAREKRGKPLPVPQIKPATPRKPGAALDKEQQQLKVRRDALVEKNYPGRVWAVLTPQEKQAIADLIEGQTK